MSGNTARHFFRNAKKTAQIIGLDVELVKHFHIILETLGCGLEIDSVAFKNYAIETRNIYLQNYKWFYMPATLHKILFHGKDIIEKCIVPIGQLSEEARETRNKECKNFREHFTRKTSRGNSNTYLIHRLLISSDSLFCSLRKPPKTKK